MKKIKQKIGLLLLIFPLMGCVPAVLVAGAATSASVGGAVIYDKRSLKTMNEDLKSRGIGQYRLNHDPLFKDHARIPLAVFNNIALLVGQAQTPEVRDHASQVISQVPHIKRVYNEVEVGNPSSFLQRTNDSWITTKVRAAMLQKSGLHSVNLKVVTENGVVYVMGTVTHTQANLAVDVARRLSGVKKVVKVFEYEE